MAGRQPERKDANCSTVPKNFKCEYREEALRAIEQEASQPGKRKGQYAKTKSKKKTLATTAKQFMATVPQRRIQRTKHTHPKTKKDRQKTTGASETTETSDDVRSVDRATFATEGIFAGYVLVIFSAHFVQ